MTWKQKVHEVIFEADTLSGKVFDILLIICIVMSVGLVMLDSMVDFREAYGPLLTKLEWIFTILFTIEYLLRLISVHRPWSYAISFFGLVDLLALLPTYLSLLIPGTHYLLAIRVLRVVRIFRVLKLVYYVNEFNYLLQAMHSSRHKINVFLLAVSTLMIVIGSMMYMIEGEENGFTSIPKSIYWAVVTVTTLGYGDLTPQTHLGQAFVTLIMICGYAVVAVPTGIVAAELARTMKLNKNTQSCPSCMAENHDDDARYCKYCSESLNTSSFSPLDEKHTKS